MGTGYTVAEMLHDGVPTPVERYTDGPRRSPIDIMLERFDRDVTAMQHLVFEEQMEAPEGASEGEAIADELLDSRVNAVYDARELVLGLYYFTPDMAYSRSFDALHAANRAQGLLIGHLFKKGMTEPLEAMWCDVPIDYWPRANEAEIEMLEAYLEQLDEEPSILTIKFDDIARFIYGIYEYEAPEAHLFEIEGVDSLAIAQARHLVELTTSRVALGICSLGGTYEGDLWSDSTPEWLPFATDFYTRTATPMNMEQAVEYVLACRENELLTSEDRE